MGPRVQLWKTYIEKDTQDLTGVRRTMTVLKGDLKRPTRGKAAGLGTPLETQPFPGDPGPSADWKGGRVDRDGTCGSGGTASQFSPRVLAGHIHPGCPVLQVLNWAWGGTVTPGGTQTCTRTIAVNMGSAGEAGRMAPGTPGTRWELARLLERGLRCHQRMPSGLPPEEGRDRGRRRKATAL